MRRRNPNPTRPTNAASTDTSIALGPPGREALHPPPPPSTIEPVSSSPRSDSVALDVASEVAVGVAVAVDSGSGVGVSVGSEVGVAGWGSGAGVELLAVIVSERG